MGCKTKAGMPWAESYYVVDVEKFKNTPSNRMSDIFNVERIIKPTGYNFPVYNKTCRPKEPSFEDTIEDRIPMDEHLEAIEDPNGESEDDEGETDAIIKGDEAVGEFPPGDPSEVDRWEIRGDLITTEDRFSFRP